MHLGQRMHRAQFEENLLAKFASPDFSTDLPLILSSESGSRLDMQRAGDLVLTRLIARVKGEAWHGPR